MGLRLWQKYVLLGIAMTTLLCCVAIVAYDSGRRAGGSGSVVVSRDAVFRHNYIDRVNRSLHLGSTHRVVAVLSTDPGRDVVKMNYVKEMMKHAWDNYKTYAWGFNEVKPVSKLPHQQSVFGGGRLGASIIDALDTLLIMNMTEEFADARQFALQELDIRSGTKHEWLSVFETNIRFVGGLLSVYALTGERAFADKAREIADILLPAFDTKTGIARSLVNPRNGKSTNYGWASGGCSILSEFGSLSLEFEYLSEVTGNATYSQKVARVRDYLEQADKPDGLYPNYINPDNGKWCLRHVSVGALGDSFYEYLYKQYLISGKTDIVAKKMYDEAMEALEQNILFKSEQNKLWYFAQMRSNRVEHKMEHLACFIVGIFALQAENEELPERRAHFLELAKQVGKTCHESYVRAGTGLGPEAFRFTKQLEAVGMKKDESMYILRPEVIEGWFYLYRVTKDPMYREWAWDFARAINKYCRVDGGFAGVQDVYNVDDIGRDDVQQSFLLAETLKYLYLIFDDDRTLAFDKWVFNTEAHPFPVRSSNLK